MKTALIYHSVDLDGFCSCAIAQFKFMEDNKACKIDGCTSYNGVSTGSNVEEMTTIPYNYRQQIPELSGYDRVIMVDISFKPECMIALKASLGKENVIWIDHHISAIKDSEKFGYDDLAGIRMTSFAACELTWMYFFEDKEMPKLVYLLGRYDCFGHKGKEDERFITEFQYGARQAYTNPGELLIPIRFAHDKEEFMNKAIKIVHKTGEAIYQYLIYDAKIAWKTKHEIRFITEFGNFKFAAVNKERFNPGNFEINYKEEGYDGVVSYYFTGKRWSFSLYSDHVDCSAICKEHGGGGHKGAAGFVIDEPRDIVKFLAQID